MWPCTQYRAFTITARSAHLRVLLSSYPLYSRAVTAQEAGGRAGFNRRGGGKSWRKIEGKLGLVRSFAAEELLAAAISD
jgi:hypothetical protein